ncbi:hypothetical protein [Cesiribacter sp. SM1]|uniref:hypothetical protein n=1 Tax=Cesiribacter sp. SM1 TaxID=2861196 RepID=UPI001CD1C0C4|nr:hypothetical protein [Cesiribacter sp. SM1]
MFVIKAHVLPAEPKGEDGQIKGAFAVLYIDYKDIDGAFILAKHYFEENGWTIKELEDEYLILNSPDDVDDENIQYYDEALEFGYSLIFYTYDNEDDDEIDSE